MFTESTLSMSLLDLSWQGIRIVKGQGVVKVKHLLVSILSFATIDAAADTKTVDRVNYHLKMIHTKMQTQEAQAQVKAHEVERSHTGDGMDFIKNDPRYGITPNDDLDTSVGHPFAITPPVKAQRIPTQSDEMSPEEKAEWIAEFKRRAAQDGLSVDVNPETLEVRVRSW